MKQELRRRIVGSELLAAKLKALATHKPQTVLAKLIKKGSI
jgi:hypothetical protein